MRFPTLHKRLILLTGIGLLIFQLSGIGNDSENSARQPSHLSQLKTSAADITPLKVKNQELANKAEKKETLENTTIQRDKVKEGDNLAKIFARNGHPAKDLHQISSTK